MSDNQISVLSAVEGEITAPVQKAVDEMNQAASAPATFDWGAILTTAQKTQAEKWAAALDPSKGDAVISGFAADIMTKIKDLTKSVLDHTAVREIPEAQAIFSAFLEDLDKVDYDFKWEKPGWLDKAMSIVGAAIDRLTRFLDSIKSLDDKLDGMEATLQKQIFVLTNFLQILQELKDEYKKLVPWMFASTYTMQLVVNREETNLEQLKAKAETFRQEHSGQGNPILNEEINEKVTQLDLCRQRQFQLAMQSAKGFVMVPVIETTMKAARIIRSEMENTINSTLNDIRATLVVIIAQSELEEGAKLVEKSDAVARKAQQALATRLEQTVGAMERMNQSKEQNLASLKEFATRVSAAIEKTRAYSAGLVKNLQGMDGVMTDIDAQFSKSLSSLGTTPA